MARATQSIECRWNDESPVLALMGGDDPGIPPGGCRRVRASALNGAGSNQRGGRPTREHPHSFFDRKYDEFANESDDAWARVLAFIEQHS